MERYTKNENVPKNEVLLWNIISIALFTSCIPTRSCLSDDTIQWMLSDSIIGTYLPNDLHEILSTPDVVNCYHVIYKDTISQEKANVLNHFVQDTLLVKLNVSQISVLQYILLSNEQNYLNDSIKVQSPCLPRLEFEFLRDKEKASIFISNLDHTWHIMQNGKIVLSNAFTDVNLIERYCNYFLIPYYQQKKRKQ